MTKNVIITIGTSGVGKSHYAERWVKKHTEYVIVPAYLDLDKTIREVLQNEYVIMDYYFISDFNANKLRAAVNCPVEIIVLFERPEAVSYRRINTKPLSRCNPVDCFSIGEFYFDELDTYIDTRAARYLDGEYREYDEDGFAREFAGYYAPYDKDEVEGYIREIDAIQEYDKYYHHFNLPHGVRIGRNGYARNEETWEIIKDWVNWSGKRVLDLCCFHGYFSQQIYLSGADVHGCDIHNHAIYSAAVFAKMNGAKIKLYHCDVDTEFPHGPFDVALLFNVFHHLKDPDAVLSRMSKYDICLFEINESDIEQIESVFNIVRSAQSPKDGRVILMCYPISAGGENYV